MRRGTPRGPLTRMCGAAMGQWHAGRGAGAGDGLSLTGPSASHRGSHEAGAVGCGWPGATVRSYGSGGMSDGSGVRDKRGRESGTRSKKRRKEVGWLGAVAVGWHSNASRSHAVDHMLKAGTVAQRVRSRRRLGVLAESSSSTRMVLARWRTVEKIVGGRLPGVPPPSSNSSGLGGLHLR